MPSTEIIPSAVRKGGQVRIPRFVLSSKHVRRLCPHLGKIMQYTPPTQVWPYVGGSLPTSQLRRVLWQTDLGRSSSSSGAEYRLFQKLAVHTYKHMFVVLLVVLMY